MIVALSDCLIEYHSFWIRVGQYLKTLSFSHEVLIVDSISSVPNMGNGDTLIIYRHQKEWGDISCFLSKLKANGVTLISDVDDYLWNDGSLRGWDQQRLYNYTKALRLCDIITCSTKELKEQLSCMFKHAELLEIENTAPNKAFKIHNVRDSKRLKIGWTGAPWTRQSDLYQLKKFANWSINQGLRWKHIGHHKGFISLATTLEIDEKYVEKVELCSYDDYIDNLNFDIGIAPLENSLFNNFKSAIKVIEYSAAGIPWVASNSITYRSLCRKWKIKKNLCNTTDDWINITKSFLNNKSLIEEGAILRRKCYEYSRHDLSLAKWKNILSINSC